MCSERIAYKATAAAGRPNGPRVKGGRVRPGGCMARKNARPFGPNESLNGDAGSATEVASTRALAAILSPLVAHWMGGGQPKGLPSPRENPAGINGSRLRHLSRGPAAAAFAPAEVYTKPAL